MFKSSWFRLLQNSTIAMQCIPKIFDPAVLGDARSSVFTCFVFTNIFILLPFHGLTLKNYFSQNKLSMNKSNV